MVRKNKVVQIFLVLLLIFFLNTVTAQELKKQGKYWVGEISKSFKVEKTGTIRMEEIKGTVKIRAWDKNEVLIKEIKRMDIFSKNEAKLAIEKTKSGYKKRGNTIEISGPAFSRSWINSNFNIFVPAGFSCRIKSQGGEIDISGLGGEVKASTGGGDVTVTDIKSDADISTGGGNIIIKNILGSLDASTGGGSVRVTGIGKNLEISTGGGNVYVDNAEGEKVDISTGGGDIKIENSKGEFDISTGGGDIILKNTSANIDASTGGGDIVTKVTEGNLDISTGGGDIDMDGIKGAVSASTGGGDVSATVILKDFSVNHSIKLSTGGGDIDLKIPEKLPAEIDAKIEYRQRWKGDYEIISDFPIEIKKETKGSKIIISGFGKINGGGDLIKLRTGGGDINIRKN